MLKWQNMKNNKKVFIVVILVTLVIIAIGAYFYTKYNYSSSNLKNGDLVEFSTEKGKPTVRSLVINPIHTSVDETYFRNFKINTNSYEKYNFSYILKNLMYKKENVVDSPLKKEGKSYIENLVYALPLSSATSTAKKYTFISLQKADFDICEKANNVSSEQIKTIGGINVTTDKGVSYEENLVYRYSYIFSKENMCFYIGQIVGVEVPMSEAKTAEKYLENQKKAIENLDVSEAERIVEEIIKSIKARK